MEERARSRQATDKALSTRLDDSHQTLFITFPGLD